MIAAAQVNWNYLLILLLPSVGVIILMALTWRSRTSRRRQSEAKQVSRGASGARGASAAKRRPAGAKQRGAASAKRRK